MGTIQVGILGMGRLGASVGLALKRASKANPRQEFVVTGYGLAGETVNEAKRLGAVDAIALSPAEAASSKEIVVMALPYADVREGYRQIGASLKEGAVVLDMSPLALPSMGWSKQFMKAGAHMIALTAVLNPKYLFDGLDDIEHAAEDLFDKGAMLLMPAPDAVREAVELASDFSEIIGAAPRFADPYEHDGWIAAVEGLPALLGVASFYALYAYDGWNDAQRAGNPSFGRLTHHLADTHPDDLRDLLLNNREATVRQIDMLVDTLGALRGALAANDKTALEEALVVSRDAYAVWLSHRRRADWGDQPVRTEHGSAGEIWMTSLLGGYIAKRLRGKGGE